MALAVGMGVCAILLSLWYREPISIAWSTPGGALLASSAVPDGGFQAAVGAFLLSGALSRSCPRSPFRLFSPGLLFGVFGGFTRCRRRSR